jgi:hypothetical protein
MNDLLKEAIADAKAVREVALANAKLALEEAFTPRLQSMLSKKLAEEAEMDDEDPAMKEVGAYDEEEPKMEGDAHGYYEEKPKMEGEDHEGDEEAKMEGEDHEGDEEAKMEGEDHEGDEQAKKVENYFKEVEDEDEIDEDLMEIIRQLEEDIDSSDIGTGGNKKPSKEASDDTTDDPGGKQKLIQLVEKEGSEEDDEVKEIMNSIHETEDDEEISETSEEDDDSIDIKEILRALREEEDEEEQHEAKEVKDDETEVYESRLKEAYAVIQFLRSKINEVNLLNSKLLFSNKIFKKHSLSESQKITVIENFDRASSLREVKLVYATLSEALKTAKIRTLKESFASKPIASTKPKAIMSEANDMADRLRKLAGLK